MALEFANLHAMRRGKDVFYCLLEVRRNLFSVFSEEYFNNCVRGLGIETFICNEEETSFIRNFLPAEIGPFFLISDINLLRLNQILLNSRQIAYQRANFGYQFSPVATTTTPSSNFLPDTEFGSWSFPGRPAQEKLADSATCVSNEEPSNKALESFPKLKAVESDGTHLATKPSEDSLSEEGDISSITEVSASTSNPRENKKSFTLTDEEMSPQLRSEFGEIRKFYSVELNADRDGYAMQDVTIDKMFERICRFLWFLRNVKSVEPQLSCCSDPQLIQEFVNYTMKVRSVKPITCSRYLTAFINVAKVPFNSNGKQDQNDSLEKIRAIQRQLERLARRERVDELAKKPQVEKIVYPELLELCRELKFEVNEKSGQSQARSCMNLCLLLLYCAANPGRSKEYISLRIYKGQSEEECKNQNFICFNEDDTVVLWEDAYKTKNTYGVNRTDLTPLSFLTYYLKLYCKKLRPLLLNGKEHDFFFVNGRGDAFTQNSYNIYVSAIFEQYFSLKLTTVDIRKAVVNHFLSLPQSGDLALRESFATLMKHSVRTQRRFYDERPLAAKKSRALDFLSSMAARGIGEDGVQIIEDEDSYGNIEVLPLPGEFVTLVAANSSRSKPEVFLAKILRLSEDRKMAFLAEFSEVEAGKFKLNAGKSYKEAVEALIYPVDVVYLHSNGLYELRTPKIDLHNQVYKH